PSLASSAETVDFPDAMPPSSPRTTRRAVMGEGALRAADDAADLLFVAAESIAWVAGFFTGTPVLRGALGRESTRRVGRNGVRPGGFQPANEAGRNARLEGVGGGPLRARAHSGGRCEAAR